jgi:hypothetical protein
MGDGLTPAALRMFEGFLARTHLSRPDDVADIVAEELEAALDATDVVLYLANYEDTELVPVPTRLAPERPAQAIDGTVAGRSYMLTTPQTAASDRSGHQRVWLPVLDGTHRMGVLELSLPVPEEVDRDVLEVLERFAHLVAHAVETKSQYGDAFERVQRSQPMTTGAELLWSVLPPPTFAMDGLVISAMLEPAYENGGDAFDYAVNDDVVHLAVFDGMGHGLDAAGSSTFAVAAYRNSRRSGLDLRETYEAMDAAIRHQFGGTRFVTAVLATLDLADGTLRWISAGHPPPLLLRNGRVVKLLDLDPVTPLGVPFASDGVTVGEEHLQSGDALALYTDGLTEARQPGGGLLTERGLAEFLQREAAAQLPTPETLRRLRRAILAHQDGVLHDDATALLVEWHRGAETRLLPQTVS